MCELLNNNNRILFGVISSIFSEYDITVTENNFSLIINYMNDNYTNGENNLLKLSYFMLYKNIKDLIINNINPNKNNTIFIDNKSFNFETIFIGEYICGAINNKNENEISILLSKANTNLVFNKFKYEIGKGNISSSSIIELFNNYDYFKVIISDKKKLIYSIQMVNMLGSILSIEKITKHFNFKYIEFNNPLTIFRNVNEFMKLLDDKEININKIIEYSVKIDQFIKSL